MSKNINYFERSENTLQKLESYFAIKRSRHTSVLRNALKQADEEIAKADSDLNEEMMTHRKTKKMADDFSLSLSDLSEKFELIRSILSAKQSDDEKYERFRKLFREDFLTFANSENIHKNEAEAVLQMQAIEEELRLLGRAPHFQNKTIVAVAGGFSSGKSSLLTSFFDAKSKISLPIAMDPVTAIPTYITHNQKTMVKGFPAHGGFVEIPIALFSKMKHEYLVNLGFDIRRILPFTVLETPWNKEWDHLCFIDTPGYNPAHGENTTRDETTTASALEQAEALIWVIGIDANGEISSSDLDFLQTHAMNLPLYIVLNKADTRPLSQVKEVTEKIKETLESYAISYLGISAFCSNDGQEYHFDMESIFTIINSWNRPSKNYEKMANKTNTIIDGYINSFEEEINMRKSILKSIHSLKLDLDELGLFDEQETKVRRRSKSKPRDNDESITDDKLPQITGILRKMLGVTKDYEIFDGKKKLDLPSGEEAERIIDIIDNGNAVRQRAQDRLLDLKSFFKIDELEKQLSEAKRLKADFHHVFFEVNHN